MLFKKTETKPLDFLIIGSQKSGTSALFEYLKEHDEIAMSYKKEMHFFNDDAFFESRKKDVYQEYENSIEFISGNEKICGEVTPIYLYWHKACERIWNYNKEIKLIAVLRNPIDRAFSHWNMSREKGIENESFRYAVLNEDIRIKNSLPYQNKTQSYVDRGFYAEQIRRYKRFFKTEQMLFIKYENFKNNQEVVLKQIFNFLDVDPTNFNYEHKTIHKRAYNAKMTDEEFLILRELFYNDIKEVERLLNWDCSDWLKDE